MVIKTNTRADIVFGVRQDTGYSSVVVSTVINSFLSNITQQLSQGNRVQLSGFGTFELKERAPRTGRNPHTGEPVPIPARFIPSFEPGEALKRAAIKPK